MKKKITSLLTAILMLFLLSCDSDLLKPSLIEMSGANITYDDSGATKHLKIATAALECSTDKEENLVAMENMITEIMADEPDVRLIVFPETTLGWYYKESNPEEYQRSIAEEIPGLATARIDSLSEQYGIYIIFGMAEIRNDTLYNSQVLVNPDGEIEEIHRKVRPFFLDEESGYDNYNNYQIFEIDNIKASMMICADSDSEWLTNKILENDVDLVITSLTSVDPPYNFSVGARRFNAWYVSANRYGTEGGFSYSGSCYIADPAGDIRSQISDDEGYTTYEIGVY